MELHAAAAADSRPLAADKMVWQVDGPVLHCPSLVCGPIHIFLLRLAAVGTIITHIDEKDNICKLWS